MQRVPVDDADPVEAVPGVRLRQLAAGERMSVQHFEIAPGETVPLHDHPQEQSGFIVGGILTFVGDDGDETVVEAGDSYLIPGDEPHAAENRGDEPVRGIDVFSPPRTNPDWESD